MDQFLDTESDKTDGDGGGSSGGGAERAAVRMNGSCGGRFQPTTMLPQQPSVVSMIAD